jgi:uncharacterized protein YodC (DUF2158 family)
MLDNEKIFFNAGQIVRLKHANLTNVPNMMVVEKVSRSLIKNGEKDTIFMGIKCRWFDKNEVLQEAIFSTKDLMHVN